MLPRGDAVTLLDAANQRPESKTPRYVALGVLAVLLVAFFVWRAVRFHPEEKLVESFLDAVVSGNMQHAYQLWQPTSSYSFKDFQDDWGANGYYGPVKSYEIKSGDSPKQSRDVSVTVLLSPYSPFPTSDPAKASKTKQLSIWVDPRTHSLSFPP
jgi:hypothetical protein